LWPAVTQYTLPLYAKLKSPAKTNFDAPMCILTNRVSSDAQAKKFGNDVGIKSPDCEKLEKQIAIKRNRIHRMIELCMTGKS
jgi:hypothetical protein